VTAADPARDTIFALSSGALPAAIAIMRISGSKSEAVLQQLAGKLPAPRHASALVLRDATGDLLDRALVLWMPGPATATGEDLVELHLHGSRAVIMAVADALRTVPGVRDADAGEFTRRAFDNGRLALDQVEGLADLLAAETALQHRHAMRRAEGGIGRITDQWQERILNLSAHVEAALQFGEDEDDVPVLDASHRSSLAALHNEVADVLQRPPAERMRDGVRVLLAGPVNAGKSSLFNALVGRSAAIVSNQEGTTRDILEAPVQIGGIPILLMDTAGLRETRDPVEQIGVGRAEAAMAAADLILWLGDPADAPQSAVIVHARMDLPGRAQLPDGADLGVSVETSVGMAELRDVILRRASSFLPQQDEVLFSHRQRDAAECVVMALQQALSTDDPVLLAHHLAEARMALDRVTGRSGVEEMLDTLFGRFCIGK
jgi:tRNA modification GTPase